MIVFHLFVIAVGGPLWLMGYVLGWLYNYFRNGFVEAAYKD